MIIMKQSSKSTNLEIRTKKTRKLVCKKGSIEKMFITIKKHMVSMRLKFPKVCIDDNMSDNSTELSYVEVWMFWRHRVVSYCNSVYIQSFGVERNLGAWVHFHSPVVRTPHSRKILIYPKSIKSFPTIFSRLTKWIDPCTEQDIKQDRESDELFLLSHIVKY